ncbi:hypothetical protein EJB05_14009, partial [Eragrostis curvula]
MSAILGALAPYVKKLIADMTEEEVHKMLGVSSEIGKLERNTESLKYFLTDAERRRITDQSVQRWVMKLKGAMYDATNILDICQLEAEKRRDSKCGNMEENVVGCLQPLLFCLRNPVFSYKIGNRIKELNQQLDDIHKEAKDFKFDINIGSNLELRKPIDVEQSSQKMTSEFNHSTIVGDKIEKDTKELVHELITNDNLDIKVVSIVGMGGIGKTTLAQKIFKEPTIEGHFKKKIWLSITQHFNEIDLLRTAIKHCGEDHGWEQDKTLLMRTLTDILSKGRFLLVMDDMWGVEAWNHVLSVPIINASHKQPGSRILITTRFEDLAWKMRAFFHQHHVSLLDEDDAWSLLKKQISPNQVTGIDRLKDIGREILKKCNGLPLAIKVMGGLLSTRYPSEHEWQVVLNHPAWSVTGLPPELDNRLYLSYEDLSPHLKQCFLYCSLFPKSQKIVYIKITSMWISEGFVQPHSESSITSSHDDQLEEVASEYYKELMKRNLIEPAEGYESTGYVCNMHDVVRSFAEFMTREESLVVVQERQANVGGGTSPVHRLCIEQTISEAEWVILQKHRSLRTLIILPNASIKLGDALGSFSFLRVLYINSVDSGSLVPFLSQLKHLRYLELQHLDISRLPDDIDKMKFLQHIVLGGCNKLTHLPSKILKLPHLRFLNISWSNVKVVPKGFGGLTSLRKLYGFPVHTEMDGNRGWCSLEEIGPLSQLRNLELRGLENVSASSWAEKAMISSKRHLDVLELYSSSSRYMGIMDEVVKQRQQQVVEKVYDELRPPSCIEHLLIHGYFGRRLPNWMMEPASSAFKSLKFLFLKDLTCCTQLPDGLCWLPCLELLQIGNAPCIKSVGPDFQASSSVAMGGGVTATSAAFPNLRSLFLVDLCEWEKWEWPEQGEGVSAEAIAMPALMDMKIKNCKLRCLPPGLANSKRHALRRLYIYNLSNLAYVDTFPSVVELDVFDCPELTRISGFSKLQRIRIVRCQKLKVFEGVPELDSLALEDYTMETLPEYLRGVNPRYLKLKCNMELHESLLSDTSSELEKIKHIRSRNIYF